MSVDLASLPVLPQKPPKHTLSSHPDHLGRHSRLGSTLPLTRASVTSLTLSSESSLGAGARMDGGGLCDDVTIFEEFLDMLARVGIADLGLLSGVEPDFTLADASDYDD